MVSRREVVRDADGVACGRDEEDAFVGALSASLWRWRDLASVRFWAVFAGVFGTWALVYLALRGALK